MKNANHKKWEEAEDQLLIKAYNEGHSDIYIGKKLDRTESGVRTRIRKLQKTGELQPRITVKRELRREAVKQHNRKRIGQKDGLLTTESDELPMSDEEIRYRHKNAENPARHIAILAELNGCTRKRIKAILADKDGAE